MALYTFDCRVCGSAFDALRPAMKCCGQNAARRSVYAVHVSGPRAQKVNVTRFLEANAELQHDSARTGVAVPDWMAMGKRKARALQAAGEPLRSKVVTEVN